MREVTLNWVQSQQTTMTAFLSLYTLHDAEMRECALLVDGSAVLTFVWDRVWLEVPFAQTHLSAPQEPWLFLQFPHVLMATIDDTAADRTYENGTVASGDSTLLNLEQRERLRATFALLRLMEPASSTSSEPVIPQETHCTTIETIFGRRGTLYHSQEVIVLCQEADGRLIHIPGL